MAGYYEIDPISYSFKDTQNGETGFTTTKSNIFYSFHKADGESPGDKPLFVMLNGGPGAGTVTNLFSMNTAPYTLDMDKQADGSQTTYSKNPYSWTSMGNVLYIDAPATGFSYLEAEDSGSVLSRIEHFFTKGNFNSFIDAAQIVRVVLRFLEDHEELTSNQVVLVGESYGGTRVSTMLNLLLYSGQYGDDGNRVYKDPSLVREIQEHFQGIHGTGTDITPEMAAEQFGRQVLIQPQLTGQYQDDITGKMFYREAPYYDTVIYDLAAETGHTFPHTIIPPKYWIMSPAARVTEYYTPKVFGRDKYNSAKYAEWSNELEAYSAVTLRDYEGLSTVLGYDVGLIDKMYAANRTNGFKYISTHHDPGLSGLADEYANAEDWYDDPLLNGYLAGDQTARVKFDSLVEAQRAVEYLTAGYLDSSRTQLWEMLGDLPGYDAYLTEMNYAVWAAFTLGKTPESAYDINPDKSAVYGAMFLENLPLVKTFLTDAANDLVIYSPAIPESLKEYGSLVKSVSYLRGSRTNGRDGYFKISYQPDAFDTIATPDSVELYYPYYADSGHSVSTAQPDKFLSDVGGWLAAN